MCVCVLHLVEDMKVVLQHKALHGPLEVGKYPKSLGGREGGGEGGRAQEGGAVPLLCGERRGREETKRGD